jgi:MFS family permease
MQSLTMFFDAAKNAAVPNIVTQKELLTANVMSLSTRFLQYTLGAALGGATAAQFGYNTAFVVNSISFIGSAFFITLIPAAAMKKDAVAAAPEEESSAAPSQVHFFRDVREGLAYIWATPFVRGVILVNIGWALGGGMPNILFDQIGGHLFAQGERGDWSVAALFASAGAGVFLGMVLARRVGDWLRDVRHAGHFIGWSLIAHGVLFAIGGLMPTLATMAVFITLSRFLLGAEFGVQETMVMRVLPDEYRGRVFTTDRSLEFGMMTLSMIVAGYLLTFINPRTMMIISGLLSASPGIVWLFVLWLTKFRVPSRAVSESYGD